MPERTGPRPTHPLALLSAFVGLCAAALGWAAGGVLGSHAPRTVCALAATALAFGLLRRGTRLAVLSAIAAGAVGLSAFQLGRSFITPLFAWPAAALAIGAVSAITAERLRTRIAVVAAAPFLGGCGFLAGYAAIFLLARSLNDARVAAETLMGGAAGFGGLLLLGLAFLGRRLDSTRIKGALS